MGTDLVERARGAYEACRWEEALDAYAEARDEAGLEVADLAAMADAAWWLGDSDRSLDLSEQAYRRRCDEGSHEQAARDAVEIGFLWLLRGEPTIGSGWISRASRLLEDLPESAAHGYLLFLDVEVARARGDLDQALTVTRQMQALGSRHDDRTLGTVGLVLEGVIRVRQGRVDDGLAVLDEAMLAVHAGDVAPSWAGNLYCQLMALFVEVADFPRARAWTDATERWCDGFSNAAMFRGICRVHQAQLLTLSGDWSGAEQHARQACRDLADMNVEAVAEGHYQLGELGRLRDDPAEAERAYARAHELGRDAQPGLALLRLLQGRPDAAASSLDAALAASDDPLRRVPLLAARVEVAAVQDDAPSATAAADELADVAERYDTPGFVAVARHAAGTARLLEGKPNQAVPLLRDACRQWHDLDARYELVRVRLRLAAALEAAGDPETAARERDLAASASAELGAVYDLRLHERTRRPDGLPLTAREVEVLRLVAAGATNRRIATALTISERTVERHVSNIFVKLDVSSRTEAAGVAFAHGLAGSPKGG